MATEKLVENLVRQIDRRNFLKKLGASTVGALLTLMGLSQAALACCVSFHCCALCCSPGPTITPGSCPTSTSDGVWCWTCGDGCQTWRCCESKQAGSNCARDCTGVDCGVNYHSSAECISGCCPSVPVR